jgi:transcriptional regulator with XRE-family HTH domain
MAARGPRGQHNPAYIRLTKELRAVRNAAGLTQRDLAAKLCKDKAIIHRCETGDRRIDPIELCRWCWACGVDPLDILATVDPEKRKRAR